MSRRRRRSSGKRWQVMRPWELNRRGFIIMGDNLLYNKNTRKWYITKEDLKKSPDIIHYREVEKV